MIRHPTFLINYDQQIHPARDTVEQQLGWVLWRDTHQRTRLAIHLREIKDFHLRDGIGRYFWVQPGVDADAARSWVELELELNPGAGGVGIYAGLNPKVSTDAIAEMKIFDLSEVDREPRPLMRIPPQYPPKLLFNRVSGRVDLLIVIDEEGRVTDHQVRRFTHNEFKREVTRVIRKWKFSPAMKDGRKVSVRKIQPFYFGKQ